MDYAAARVTKDLFTIVITVFEREMLLPYALQSLAWQTHASLEILIYADGPSRKTEKILASAEQHLRLRGRMRYVELPPRPGYFGNHLRELGLREAKGEFISFLSHDTIYHPDFCAVHAEVLRRQPCISVTQADYWWQAADLDYPVYVTQQPRRAPGLATSGQIDAHCLAYPTDVLRTHAKFDDQLLQRHQADFLIFEQMRQHLPLVYNGLERRPLAAHM